MTKPINLTGKVFGEWTVLSRAENLKKGSARWLCRCTCGREKIVISNNLMSGKSKSCGCSNRPFIDLTGKRFGEWLVFSKADRIDTSHKTMWLCRCSCGAEKAVSRDSLIKGKSISCGCLRNISIPDGAIFGEWTVLHRINSIKKNSSFLCRCSCGRESIVIGSNLVNGKSRSCRSCSILGDKHPRWNPNLTDEERDLNSKRKYPEYIKWRREVYEKNNYICNKCGERHNLNAHHIENYASNPKLRIALSNGITLCEDCHKDFHHQYGYINNTRKQLIEFMGWLN